MPRYEPPAQSRTVSHARNQDQDKLPPKMHFVAGPPVATTRWAHTYSGACAPEREYFSRSVTIWVDGMEAPVMSHMRVWIKPPPERTYNMARMVLSTSEVAAVARKLSRHVPIDRKTVQFQNCDRYPGWTVFPVFLTYGRPEEFVEIWTPDGRPLTPAELEAHVKQADALQMPVVAAVDFEVTLSYRGAEVGEDRWETTPMSLRFRPRKIVLRTADEVQADKAALKAITRATHCLDGVAYATQRNMLL